MTANKLELKHIGAMTESLKQVAVGALTTTLANYFPENGLVTVYLDHSVLIGKWVGDFQFPDDQAIEEQFIQKIRVFNPTQEFYAWRTTQGFNGRFRKDNFEGSGVDVVVAEQVLLGTKMKKNAAGFTAIFEQRGACLTIPFENIAVVEKQQRIFIKTHHYLEYNPMGQAGYADCRFVAFTDGKKDLT